MRVSRLNARSPRGWAFRWLSAHRQRSSNRQFVEVCAAASPGTPVRNTVVVRAIYVLSSNVTTKFADWVAHRVAKSAIGPKPHRNISTDHLLAGHETLEPSDWMAGNAALEIERGHLALLARLAGTRQQEYIE